VHNEKLGDILKIPFTATEFWAILCSVTCHNVMLNISRHNLHKHAWSWPLTFV